MPKIRSNKLNAQVTSKVDAHPCKVDAIGSNPILGSSIEELVADAECSATSFFYFLVHHCVSLNQTNNSVALIPNWDFIRDLADKLQNHKGNIVIIKSRQMLTSWIFMCYALWCLLYKENFSIKLLSKKGEAVSDGTAESLIGKIQFVYDRLPQHLKQTLVTTSRPMRMINKNNNSTISGEATSNEASRGSTNSLCLIDEWAYLENDDLIFRSVVMASERVIGWSTPDGESGTFHRIYTETKSNGFLKMKIHWTQHPHRDAEWYKKKTASMTEEDKAKELECSFRGSHKGGIFTVVPEKHLCNEYKLHLPAYRLVGGMDFGLSDETTIVTAIMHKETGKLSIVASLTANEMLPEAFYATYIEQLTLLGLLPLLDRGIIYGDPSGWNRSIRDGKKVADDYRQLGLPMAQAPRAEIIDRIREIQRWLASDKLEVFLPAQVVMDTIQAAHYPVKDGTITSKDRWADPSKYYNVHMMDATGYLLHSLALPVVENKDMTPDNAWGEEEFYGKKGHIGLG